MSRYQRIKIINEQKYLERVMKYTFPYTEHRMPRYRWKRMNMNRRREHFRLKIAGREVEKVFQFRRPFRGKAGFRMSAYRPKYGLVDDVNENSVDELQVR